MHMHVMTIKGANYRQCLLAGNEVSIYTISPIPLILHFGMIVSNMSSYVKLLS
jgi:hypothetical protein